MENFTGTNPETIKQMENNMVETISQNSGTNPETNHNNHSQNETISRKLSKEERKRLGNAQTSLRQKNKKLERLNVEKTDLKKTLKRGYRIIVAKKEGENENPKKTHVTLSSLDKLQIKDRIIDIDIELFDVKTEINQLKKEISSKRHKSIKAKNNVLSGKKMAQKQKRNAIFQGEEDLAAEVSTESGTESKNTQSSNQEPVIQKRKVQTQSETESEDTQSSDGEFDFMDRREPATVSLQNKGAQISITSDAEVI